MNHEDGEPAAAAAEDDTAAAYQQVIHLYVCDNGQISKDCEHDILQTEFDHIYSGDRDELIRLRAG